MRINSKVGQTVAQEVAAGANGKITATVNADGTVESVKLRIYQGAENTLHLRPVRISNGNETALIDYGGSGKQFIDGDDDVWEWSISESVEEGDEIGVRYNNTDPNNPHNFRMTSEVDYAGGTHRLSEWAAQLFQPTSESASPFGEVI